MAEENKPNVPVKHTAPAAAPVVVPAAKPVVHSTPSTSTAPVAPGAHEFGELVRLVDKDIKGHVSIFMAMTHVRGCDFMMANAICHVLDLDKTAKCGDITQEQLDKIEDCMRHPDKYGIPSWMFNHRKDLESGADKHMVSAELKLQNEMDIRFLRKIRVYRGIRHAKGSKKVRGQHTRSTGRKGGQVGVIRKKKGAPEGQAKKLAADKGGKK